MEYFKIIDTNGFAREITAQQMELVKTFTRLYDVDTIMYLNKICIVVFHADFKARYIHPDGTVTDSIILDV